VITRITRGWVRPNSEARVFDILRTAVAATGSRPNGMLGMSLSRNVGDQGIELVSVTVWSDVDSMAAVIGPHWREPAWLPGLTELVFDSRVEMLETVVSSFEDLRELEQTG
jgi:hypothetical protein